MCVRRSGAGPELVWIHGLGEWSGSFEPLASLLSSYTHVFPDLPGYGRSPWTEPESLAAVAAHLAHWLAGRPPVILAGHSMGGVLATLVAEQIPVHAVVNLDGNVTRGDCTFSARAAGQPLEVFIAGGFEQMRLDVFASAATAPALRGYHAALAMASPATFHHHAVDLVRLSETATLGPRLAALTIPKLFIAGVPNGICGASRAELDRLGIPWVGIEPAGHWVFVDQARACADAIEVELDRIRITS